MMILVKRRNLYILITLICFLLILGELRFFHALSSVELSGNLAVKYQVESFIFASVILTLVVYLFLVYFMRQSDNVMKRLDKMIELSGYGEHDISMHLKKLGKFGKKIDHLIYNIKALNDMKSLKISSLAGIKNLLIQKNSAPLFLLNRHGNIAECSDAMLKLVSAKREEVIKRNFDELFRGVKYEELFFDLEKIRERNMTKSVVLDIGGRSHEYNTKFYAIDNANGEISHIVGVFGS